MSTTETHNSAPDTNSGTKKPKKSKWRRFWKIVKYLLGTGFVLGVFGAIVAGVLIIRWTRDLPTLEAVKEYSPSVMSRVHAGDGKLIAEYGIEKRVFVSDRVYPITNSTCFGCLRRSAFLYP